MKSSPCSARAGSAAEPRRRHQDLARGAREAFQCYSDHVQHFSRITTNPDVMGGKPCIRGMRVTVGMIVEALGAGRSVENLLSDFPYLEEQDIREALAYAANLAQGREFPLAS